MVKELVFHIGDHKTGSTAIQAALAAAAYAIDGVSVHYACDGLNNNFMVAPLMGGRPDPAASAPRFARRAAELDASGADIGVLSAEDCEYVAPEVLDRMLESRMPQYRDRLRLVVYLRPHADRFVSSFVERSRLGQIDTGMEAFYPRARRQGMLDYAPRMARWHRVFGERLIVRPFLRERLAGGDVVRDFLGILGGGRPVRLAETALRHNESVSVEDLALLMHVQARINAAFRDRPRLLPAIRGSLGWNLAALLNDRPGRGRTPVRLHADLGRRLVSQHRADAELIDRRWFEGAPMSAAIAAAGARFVAAPQGFALADHFDAETIRQTEIWCAVLIRLIGAAPKRFVQAIRDPGGDPGGDPDERGAAGGGGADA